MLSASKCRVLSLGSENNCTSKRAEKGLYKMSDGEKKYQAL